MACLHDSCRYPFPDNRVSAHQFSPIWNVQFFKIHISLCCHQCQHFLQSPVRSAITPCSGRSRCTCTRRVVWAWTLPSTKTSLYRCMSTVWQHILRECTCKHTLVQISCNALSNSMKCIVKFHAWELTGASECGFCIVQGNVQQENSAEEGSASSRGPYF
jgi:hypothetical protein